MNIKYRELNPIMVSAMHGHGNFLGSERQQAEVLKDIGPALASLPAFTDNARWSESSSVSDVLFHCVRQLPVIAKENGMKWKISADKEKGWMIQALVPIYQKYDAYLVPCCFLPVLKQFDEELHDLIFYPIIYFMKVQKMRTWGEEVQYSATGWTGSYYEQIEEKIHNWEDYGGTDEEDKKNLKAILEKYNYQSEPAKYFKLLNKTGFSLKIFKEKLKLFKPNNPVRKAYHEWIVLGLELMESGDLFHNYVHDTVDFVDGYSEGTMKAEDCIGFMWDCDDVMGNHIDSHLEDWSQNVGGCPMYQLFDLHRNLFLPEGLKINPFPFTLLKFMELGCYNYNRLKTRFYPNGLRPPRKKKAPTLLEILLPEKKNNVGRK